VPSVQRSQPIVLSVYAVCVCGGRGKRCGMPGVRGRRAWREAGAAQTYVALTFALGSEAPPAIVAYGFGGDGVQLG
jgi:hypothetical protein